MENRVKAGTILVVDDEELVCAVTSLILRRQGYEVLTASSGRLGLETLAHGRERIDLVIMDLGLPDMNGSETYDRMRLLCHKCKVIISSGTPEEELRSLFVGRGVDGFLNKPFDTKNLISQVSDLLA